jgi:hypothetical protein
MHLEYAADDPANAIGIVWLVMGIAVLGGWVYETKECILRGTGYE